MSAVNHALNPFAALDAARLYLRGQGDPLQVPPGTTITARYQYKVTADGSLLPTRTDITTESGTERRPGNFLRRQDERRQSFADLAKPRPQLTPADELQLFAANSNEPPAILHGEAKAGDGTAIDVEILPPHTQPTGNPISLATVATLYARNNDIVYNVTPLTLLAA